MRARVCRVLAAGLFSLYGAGVAAVIPDWPQAGWIWTEERRADLSGIHLFQRELSAPLAPAELARTLSLRLPQFSRLMVLDGQILLSGLNASHHWLARIERAGEGARVMISAMAVREVDGGRGGVDSAFHVPADMRLRFSHTEFQGGRRVVQALYISGRSRSAVAQQVSYALSKAGWSTHGSRSGAAHRPWRRAGEQLDLSVHEHASGSLLWLQHQEIGVP